MRFVVGLEEVFFSRVVFVVGVVLVSLPYLVMN